MLSLFSGCGGMDLGFEGGFTVFKKSINPDIHKNWVAHDIDDKKCFLKKTGFKLAFANDIRPGASLAWSRYFGARGVSQDFFHLCSIVDLVNRHRSGETIFPSGVDIITGGFPCQDFSVAGKRKGLSSNIDHLGNKADGAITPNESRGELYKWMKHVIEIVRPKVFVAENVKGLTNFNDMQLMIQDDFKNIPADPYVVINAKVLHAAEFGVPQSRERVIFIGFKRSALTKNAYEALASRTIPEEFDPYPPATHFINNRDLLNGRLMSSVILADVLKDLPEPESALDNSQKKYSKAKYMGSHCQGQTEVNLSGIGPTIRSEHHGNIEFRRLAIEHGGKYEKELAQGLSERRLTVRECARIQTFSDDYEFIFNGFKGQSLSASESYKLIGNAVPPLLAYHIAQRLEDNWEKYFGE